MSTTTKRSWDRRLSEESLGDHDDGDDAPAAKKPRQLEPLPRRLHVQVGDQFDLGPTNIIVRCVIDVPEGFDTEYGRPITQLTDKWRAAIDAELRDHHLSLGDVVTQPFVLCVLRPGEYHSKNLARLGAVSSMCIEPAAVLDESNGTFGEFDQMRLDLYDNHTILVVADPGDTPRLHFVRFLRDAFPLLDRTMNRKGDMGSPMLVLQRQTCQLPPKHDGPVFYCPDPAISERDYTKNGATILFAGGHLPLSC